MTLQLQAIFKCVSLHQTTYTLATIFNSWIPIMCVCVCVN